MTNALRLTATTQFLLNGNSDGQQPLQLQYEQKSQLIAEDTRALQLALELSMASFNDCRDGRGEGALSTTTTTASTQATTAAELSKYAVTTTLLTATSQPTDTMAVSTSATTSPYDLATLLPCTVPSNLQPTSAADERFKKSQNMTECVPVPSSEHVAEIVGRQGCKIKALRAKTNTYIKTPVRGDEPVFIITGRKEDVAKAQREILSAADHFSLIRATRRPSYELLCGSKNDFHAHSAGSGACSNGCDAGGTNVNEGIGVTAAIHANINPAHYSQDTLGGIDHALATLPPIVGQVTIQVRVPYRVVGLVVGTKGATIKHIQQETQTYIVTPSREKEPIFEVTGMPENVQKARQKIEAHIAMRTGHLEAGAAIPQPLPAEEAGIASSTTFDGNVGVATADVASLASLHSINQLSQFLNDEINFDVIASLYRNSLFSNGNNNNKGIVHGTAVNNHSYIMQQQMALNDGTRHAAGESQQHSSAVAGFMLPAITDADADAYQEQQQKHQADVAFHLSQKLKLQQGALPSDNAGEHNFGVKLLAKADQQQMHFDYLHSNEQPQEQQSAVIMRSNTKTTNPGAALDAFLLNGDNNTKALSSSMHQQQQQMLGINAMLLTRSCSSASSTSSTKSITNGGNSSNSSSRPELINIWRNNNSNSQISHRGYLCDSVDVDEGLGESPHIWHLPSTTPTAISTSHKGAIKLSSTVPTASLQLSSTRATPFNDSPATSISPTDSLLCGDTKPTAALGLQQQNMNRQRRNCLLCNERAVGAMLLPCGHQMFCMDCATRICTGDGGVTAATCPICSLNVCQVLSVFT